MERLTDNESFCSVIDCEGRGTCKIKINCYEKRLHDRLKEYEDLEEQGRLIVLPCNLGDKLFVLTSDSPTGIEETNCSRINVYQKRVKVYAQCQYDDWGSAKWCFGSGNFGKTVFLTKAEAEKALEEMEK